MTQQSRRDNKTPAQGDRPPRKQLQIRSDGPSVEFYIRSFDAVKNGRLVRGMREIEPKDAPEMGVVLAVNGYGNATWARHTSKGFQIVTRAPAIFVVRDGAGYRQAKPSEIKDAREKKTKGEPAGSIYRVISGKAEEVDPRRIKEHS